MIEQLWTSSILILAIVLIRLLLRGKRSARLQYGLWLLAALRLLIPGSLLAQPWSALSLAQSAGLPQAVEAVRYETETESVYGALADGETPTEYVSNQENLLWIGSTVDGTYRITAAEEAEPGEVRLDLEVERDRFGFLRLVWYAGMAVMAVWFLLANLLFGLRLRRTARRTEIPAARPVYTADLPSPCIWGLFRPNIYVTAESLQNADRLRYVLAHEEAHLRHGDPFWSLVRCACLVIWWFHPLVWLAAVLSRRDCELAADEAAVRRLGEAERLAYGRTLLDMVAQKPAPGTLLQTATTMHAGSKDLRTRITRIASARPMKAWALVLALLLAAIAAGCVFTGTQGAASDGEMEAPEGALQAQRQDTPVEADSEGEPDVADPEYAWRRYPGEYAGDYSSLHVEDAQGNDISAQLIDLWYASSAVYNVDDYTLFDRGETVYPDPESIGYIELKNYEQVVSAVFTQNGRRQMEQTCIGGTMPLIFWPDSHPCRMDARKTGYFYGSALEDMTVLSAEPERLTLQVTYARDQGLAAQTPAYDTLEWVVVLEDGLWKVDSYPYPEAAPLGILYAVSGNYTDSVGNECAYFYQVPLLLSDSQDAQAVNQAIRQRVGAVVEEQLEAMELGVSLIVPRVACRAISYDGILTLLFQWRYPGDFVDYAVYHYDTAADQMVSNEALLERLGISKAAYLSSLQAAAEQEFLASVPNSNLDLLGGQEFYDEQYAFTMSEDNLNLDTMIYWDSSAKGLCAIVPIGSFAGASWYYHVLTVDVAAGNHVRVFREPEEIFVYPYSEEELEAALTAAGEGAKEIADEAGTASFERKILTFDPMLTDIHVRQKIAASPVDGWTEADYYAHNISFTLIYSAAYGHDDTFLSDAEDAVIGIHLYREDIQSPWVLETMGMPTADYSYAIQNREDLAQFETAGKRILAGYQPAEQEYWLYVLDLETETVSYEIRR